MIATFGAGPAYLAGSSSVELDSIAQPTELWQRNLLNCE
jgi:hypothetical protein